MSCHTLKERLIPTRTHWRRNRASAQSTVFILHRVQSTAAGLNWPGWFAGTVCQCLGIYPFLTQTYLRQLWLTGSAVTTLTPYSMKNFHCIH